jgi:thioester reductase-like protein
MAETAFVTGFPGFIGRRLVAGLLERDVDQRVAALVEPRMLDAARAAVAQIPGGDRVELVEGDIAARGLGLDAQTWTRLTGEVTRAFHLAAIYDLATPLPIAQRVNVDGTGNVLELAAAAEHLERLNYVSTAYVAGLRTGVVYEHELSLGQRHKNHYESTKFQAEVWVRQAMERIPTTITRPAIVVGDSRTGETQKFDGPYYVLRTVSALQRRGLPIAGFGHPGSPFNVVPVDFVVRAILAADLEPSALGQTLHLVDPEPLSAKELVELLAKTYAGADVRGHVPSWLLDLSLRSKAVRTLFGGTPRESIRYLNHPVRFDTRVAGDVLRAAGVRPPRFPEYVRPVVEYFRAHEHDAAL